MATYLVFDTETTGKIPNHIKTIYSNNIKDIPRLTQIAWTLYSDSGEVINKRCELIKPNGFDEMIMAAEFIRLNAVVGKRIDKICTMQLSTEYCQVPSPYKRGTYKWPTLMELHTHLFKVGFEGAHDAMVDVEACGRSLFELMKRGIITE